MNLVFLCTEQELNAEFLSTVWLEEILHSMQHKKQYSWITAKNKTQPTGI